MIIMVIGIVGVVLFIFCKCKNSIDPEQGIIAKNEERNVLHVTLGQEYASRSYWMEEVQANNNSTEDRNNPEKKQEEENNDSDIDSQGNKDKMPSS